MKKVVIVGGGFAGSSAAQGLEENFDVTLIDSKDYFEFTPSVPRTLVEPQHVKKIHVLHKDYLKKSKIIVGKVDEINENFVKLKNEKIYFDYLVIASGSDYIPPFKERHLIVASRADNLIKQSVKLMESKNILIIGGGLVGVELAGEIASYYSDKEITLVHGGSVLIERNPKKASEFALKYLRGLGINVVFDEFIISGKNNEYQSKSGKKYEADLVFSCNGIKPNFKMLKGNLSKSLDKKNHLKVNEFLQVEGYRNIFAAGDIISISVEKTAQNAERQAEIVVKNINAIESGMTLNKYRPKKTPLVISLGQKKGIFTWGKFVWCGYLPAIMKNIIEWKEMRKKRI